MEPTLAWSALYSCPSMLEDTLFRPKGRKKKSFQAMKDPGLSGLRNSFTTLCWPLYTNEQVHISRCYILLTFAKQNEALSTKAHRPSTPPGLNCSPTLSKYQGRWGYWTLRSLCLALKTWPNNQITKFSRDYLWHTIAALFWSIVNLVSSSPPLSVKASTMFSSMVASLSQPISLSCKIIP